MPGTKGARAKRTAKGTRTAAGRAARPAKHLQTPRTARAGKTTRSKSPRTTRAGKTTRSGSPTHLWSAKVTESSDALDLESDVFKRGPTAIARSIKRSAERSKRRKSSPYRSAMSILTFYENRAGKNLSARQRNNLERAKDALRKLFGRA
jgi:Protein of unknown function (DUF3175)